MTWGLRLVQSDISAARLERNPQLLMLFQDKSIPNVWFSNVRHLPTGFEHVSDRTPSSCLKLFDTLTNGCSIHIPKLVSMDFDSSIVVTVSDSTSWI